MKHEQHRPEESPDRVVVQGASPDVQRLFSDAVRHHQAGRLTDAERLYRQVLALDPRHAAGLHLLGVVGGQTGRHDLAADMIGRAIAINPKEASYHCNMGIALKQHERLDEAVACFRTALDLRPDYAEAHNNLGIALKEQARLDEAIACHRKAIDLAPTYAGAHNNLGNALKDQGRLDEAIACYRRAIGLAPNYPGAHNNLGVALKQQARLDDAIACFRKAIALNPSYSEAHNNLGIALKEQARPDEAIASFRMALDLEPDFPEAYNNLGTVLGEQARQDEAVACYRRAIDLRPGFAEAHNNLGTALRAQERLDDGVASYRRAIDLNADYAEAHNNLAMALLARGDLAAGWEEYEWRWKTPQLVRTRPRLRAAAVARRAGRGADAADPCRARLRRHACSSAATLRWRRRAGCGSSWRCSKPLVRLLRSLPGVDRVVAQRRGTAATSICTARCSACRWRWAPRSPAFPAPCPICTPIAAQVAAWRTRARRDGQPGSSDRAGMGGQSAQPIRRCGGARPPALDRPGPAGAAVRGARTALLQLAKGRPRRARALPADRLSWVRWGTSPIPRR